MPSFLTARLLLAVVASGSALAAGLLLITAASRRLRIVLGSRRARAESQVRPMVLAAASGEPVPPELISARGARGRAAERVLFGYLAQLRGDAASVLADVLRERGTVARQMRATGSPSSHRRARAAERLGLIASPEAERCLTGLVSGDPKLEVRIVATRALGKTGSAAAARTLLSSLSQAVPVPEGIVASALLELGPEAVPALRAELAGGRRQRAMAADVLGLLDELPAWQGLVANVAAGDLEVRASAVRALGRLGLPSATGPVSACLDPGEQPQLRAAAARALGGISDPRSVPALAACLGDPHYWVAHNAAAALAKLGEPGVAALARAAAGEGGGAAHAREALAWRALARGETPAVGGRPARIPALWETGATAGPAPAAPAPAATVREGAVPDGGGRAAGRARRGDA